MTRFGWLIAALWCMMVTAQGQEIPMGPWRVSLDGGASFHDVLVPGPIEDQLDVHFDGVSIYQTEIAPVAMAADQRLLFRFEGAATLAHVYLNDHKLGEHLGAWTPFTLDATEIARQLPTATSWTLRIEVDEKVGHNTQGFLPIITHHFGGLWQPVSARITASQVVLIRDAMYIQWHDRQRVRLQVPVSAPPKTGVQVHCRVREKSRQHEPENAWRDTHVLSTNWSTPNREQPWISNSTATSIEERLATIEIELPWPADEWSPERPTLYEFGVELFAADESTRQRDWASVAHSIEQTLITTGYRTIVTDGDRFVLNGQPRVPRGVLNWGYAPSSVAPSLDEEWMRTEIEFAQQRGFNLMKFCLWIPPKRYFELCDELGMLAWVEYPTWHPQLDGKHLEELRREYAEFFEFDRNHPSVILRSLTCETGPSAELAVIQSLYDLCKAYIPGALVVDDSSWISWNRVYDFFDDHPYGNNHTWVATLTRLKEYIAQRETKPLMLGEAIAADSWTVPHAAILEYAESSPAHGPWSVADNLRWQSALNDLATRRGRRFDAESLHETSIHYGMLMRKYQIETYRREVPYGGYVVSVIRDFPKAAMGLIDFENQPKNSADDWSFHGSSMLLLATPHDARSFFAGQSVPLTFIAVSDGLPIPETTWTINWNCVDPQSGEKLGADRLTWTTSDPWRERISASWSPPQVIAPRRVLIRAEWLTAGADGTSLTTIAHNEWPVWVFPASETKQPRLRQIHASARDLASHFGALIVEPADPFSIDDVVVTRRLDSELLDFLEQGGKVWMIPDGSEGSFPVADHWFLRGSVVTLPRQGSVSDGDLFVQMITELQHFDLAGPVVTNIDHFLARTDPIVLLWDNHDRRDVLTHGLVFRMGVGESGELLVSTLNLWGETNAAGSWLMERWHQHLVNSNPLHGYSLEERNDNLAVLRAELQRQSIPLHTERWRFQPDPDGVGASERWFATDIDDGRWARIRIDRHWEGQGYADLDGWAWYRREVFIPDDWKSPATFLNFTGIDDYANIYVNGELVGTAGDIESRRTAFDERISLDISRHIRAGDRILITVAVYDWYGAGGIFRPVTLTTEPLSDSPPMLK